MRQGLGLCTSFLFLAGFFMFDIPHICTLLFLCCCFCDLTRKPCCSSCSGDANARTFGSRKHCTTIGHNQQLYGKSHIYFQYPNDLFQSGYNLRTFSTLFVSDTQFFVTDTLIQISHLYSDIIILESKKTLVTGNCKARWGK